MEVVVSLPGNSLKVMVKMLLNSSVFQSVILEGVLPLSDESAMGSDVPVLGFGMESIGLPLHKILVKLDLVSGEIDVGVHPGFPVKGVAFLMGGWVESISLASSDADPC